MGTGVGRCALVIAIAILGAAPTGAAQLQPVATERIADVTLRILVEGVSSSSVPTILSSSSAPFQENAM